MSEIAVRPPFLERASPLTGARPSGEETGLYGVDRPGVAWDWMKQTGQAPGGADWVRPQVAEAWARCIEDHALLPGVDPAPGRRDADSRAAPIEAPLGAVASDLAATAYDLRSLLGDAEVALLLTDPEAAVIQFFDHGLDISAGAAPMTRVGADWREAALGNNGVGTASLLCAPVAFDGKEHFRPRPAPLRDRRLPHSLSGRTDRRDPRHDLGAARQRAAHARLSQNFAAPARGQPVRAPRLGRLSPPPARTRRRWRSRRALGDGRAIVRLGRRPRAGRRSNSVSSCSISRITPR